MSTWLPSVINYNKHLLLAPLLLLVGPFLLTRYDSAGPRPPTPQYWRVAAVTPEYCSPKPYLQGRKRGYRPGRYRGYEGDEPRGLA